MLTSGPPELPRLIGASVWMNDSYSLMSNRVALERRDDAGRHALAQPERRADGHDQLANLELAAVALGKRRVAGVVDLDDRHVRLLVGADHRRLGLDTVPERDGDLFGVFDDVVVGQDMTLVVVDEARPKAAAPRKPNCSRWGPDSGPKNFRSISSRSCPGSPGLPGLPRGLGIWNPTQAGRQDMPLPIFFCTLICTTDGRANSATAPKPATKPWPSAALLL